MTRRVFEKPAPPEPPGSVVDLSTAEGDEKAMTAAKLYEQQLLERLKPAKVHPKGLELFEIRRSIQADFADQIASVDTERPAITPGELAEIMKCDDGTRTYPAPMTETYYAHDNSVIAVVRVIGIGEEMRIEVER